jgi:ABC-2 type transport system permease protein
MAIFQKAYCSYSGELSSIYARPLVIFRYSLDSILSSRLFLSFMLVCLLPSFAVMCVIYLHYNFDTLMQLEIPLNELVVIDADFFATYMLRPQLFFVFVLIMFIGPKLISPDFRNSALSLYLSRPITKTSYVVGKLLVLVSLSSLISWIPSTLLILFQASMVDGPWLSQNSHLIFAVISTSLIWIISLSMMSLAISACVKWAPVAGLFFFGIVFVGSGFGALVNELFGTWHGKLFSLFESLAVVVQATFRLDGFSVVSFGASLSVFALVFTLSTLILYRRIRGLEVVS